jgi:DNA-binding NtrC family response regulator
LQAKSVRKLMTATPVAVPQLATPAVVPVVPQTQPEIESPILEQVTKAKHMAETEAILAALNSTHWNRKQAAALLKIDYKALLYKMKKLGVEDKPVPYTAEAEAPASWRAATG